MEKIPLPLIAYFSEYLAAGYTHSELSNIFLAHDIDPNDCHGNKAERCQQFFKITNERNENTLKYIESIITKIFNDLDSRVNRNRFEWEREEVSKEVEKDKNELHIFLKEKGFAYENEKLFRLIDKASPLQTTLYSQIKENGYAAVLQEIERIDVTLQHKDYSGTAHKTTNLLESVFKHYLDIKNISYLENAKAGDLWDKVASNMKLKPQEYTNIDTGLRDIASSFMQIVKTLTSSRNDGGSHGKSAAQYYKYKFQRRHANLLVNASVTVSRYLFDYLEENNNSDTL
ncbi:MAG: abortive infection family protein [Anaerotignum sp.]